MEFNNDKILKIDICAPSGYLIFQAVNNYHFPLSGSGDFTRMIIKGKDLPIFQRGSLLSCIFYTKAAERILIPSIVEISVDFQLAFRLQLSKLSVMKERRRYFKIETNERCRISALKRDSEYFDVEPNVASIIKNINIGGVLLSTDVDLDFNVGDVVTCVIPNMIGNKVIVDLKVLRVGYSLDGASVNLGCSFLNIDKKTEKIISRYINHIQVENKKLESNLP